MSAKLSDALEAELERILAEPAGSVRAGQEDGAPYEPTVARGLISDADPAVTQRLLAEMRGADRIVRLALLHIVGRRADATVDDALLETLEDPELTATSAHLLGRRSSEPGERDVEAIRTALRRHLTDDGTFEDPFSGRTFATRDFALAAYVRVTGPERFRHVDDDLVGYRLPSFEDRRRNSLLAQASLI